MKYLIAYRNSIDGIAEISTIRAYEVGVEESYDGIDYVIVDGLPEPLALKSGHDSKLKVDVINKVAFYEYVERPLTEIEQLRFDNEKLKSNVADLTIMMADVIGGAF